MSRSITRLVLAAVGLCSACDYAAPGGTTSGGQLYPKGASADGRTIETFVTPYVIQAGAVATIECVVAKGGEHLAGAAVEIAIEPDDTGLYVTAGQAAFRPTRSGVYQIRCATADGAVRDETSVPLTVQPGPPVELDTVLDLELAPAGMRVAVACPLLDAYGNAVVGAATGLETNGPLTVEPDPLGDYFVRGSLAGEFDLACEKDGEIDGTPAVLTVIPGPPGGSQTVVDRTTAGPTEVVSVSCSVDDGYGNPLDGPEPEFFVMPPFGESAGSSGLLLTASGFSARSTGEYQVFCHVPGYAAADESPATVVIEPGLPKSWIVELPVQDCYWQDRALPLAVEVMDAWGNPVPDAPIELEATPSYGVFADERGWHITEEGDYDVVISVGGEHADDADLAPQEFSFRVDSTAPEFQIVSPARAEAILGGTTATSSVAVSGNVVDSLSDIVSVTFDGVAQVVPAHTTVVPLSHSLTSRWGMGVVTGEAVDACGNRRVLAQSYLRSPSYYSASTTQAAGARVGGGALGRLNQVIIDDAWRADLDDLASLGEAALRAFDFNAALSPGAVLASDPIECDGTCPEEQGYTFWRHPQATRRISVSGPYIHYIRAVSGGFEFEVEVQNFAFPWRLHVGACAWYTFCQTFDGTFDGWVQADWVRATGTLGLSAVGGKPTVSVHSIDLATQDFSINVQCDDWIQWFCDWAAEQGSNLARQAMEDAVEQAVRDELPPALNDALDGFSFETGFDLPAPLSRRINMASGLETLRFCGPDVGVWGANCTAAGRSADLGAWAQVFPTARGVDIPTTSRGAIRRDGGQPSFSSSAYAFGIGLKDDLLNQALWAVWYSGALDVDETDIAVLAPDIDLEGSSVRIVAKSPPVLMPGTAEYPIEVGIGDLYIDATVDAARLLGEDVESRMMHVTLYVSAIAAGNVDIDPDKNQLVLALSPEPQIWIEVVSLDVPGYEAAMSDLFNQVAEVLVPQLMSDVVGAFPIPTVELPEVPGWYDTEWSLANGELDRSGGYFRLTGSIR